jgi:hypothetical protein
MIAYTVNISYTGWHEKMTGNPHMNTESRNQALVGMADGMPVFRDKNSRSVLPVALRLAGQPDSVSKKFNNIHLAALFPCDYWIVDKDTGLLKRERHKPSNVGALLVLLVQDLLYWYEGKTVIDYNLAEHDPARKFTLRAVLLFWCGDYPGLGEVTNFSHSGYNACHWCKERGEHSKSLHRMVFGRYKRYTTHMLQLHTHDVTQHQYTIAITYMCTLFVHCGCNVYILYTLCALCTLCALYVHIMYSLCHHCAHYAHIICIVHIMCTLCALYVHTLYGLCTSCAHHVHIMCTLCMHCAHYAYIIWIVHSI